MPEVIARSQGVYTVIPGVFPSGEVIVYFCAIKPLGGKSKRGGADLCFFHHLRRGPAGLFSCFVIVVDIVANVRWKSD